MKNSILRYLGAIASIVLALGQAHAGQVQSTGLTMDFNTALTPTSQLGNSFTFAFPAWMIYQPGGNFVPYIDREVFSFTAQPGYVLSGKMSVQISASYELAGTGSPAASINLGFDVLRPWCSGCGPFSADYINSSSGYASSSSGPTGSLYVDAGSSAASGKYDHLLMYMVNFPSLTNYQGKIDFESITITAETISAVPEMPPAAMLTFGLALIGVCGYLKKQKSSGTAFKKSPFTDRHALSYV